MNPILPKNHYTPDVDTRVWVDGRIYLYGSNDICANTVYCSREYRVYSSFDMEVWQDHGISFTGYGSGTGDPLCADCVYKDGVYYRARAFRPSRRGVCLGSLHC